MAYRTSTPRPIVSSGTITTPPPSPVSAPRKPAKNAPNPTSAPNWNSGNLRRLRAGPPQPFRCPISSRLLRQHSAILLRRLCPQSQLHQHVAEQLARGREWSRCDRGLLGGVLASRRLAHQ